MIKCNSCGVDNNEGTSFCSSCGAKIGESNNTEAKTVDNVEKVKGFIDDIAKNEKSKKVLSYVKGLDKNQKIISIISAVLILGFFLPYISGDSLFSFGGYAWLMFLIPLLILAIQYCYIVIKQTKFHKLLGHIIILILSTVVTTFNLVIYFALDAFSDMLRMMGGGIDLSLGFIVSLFGFIGILVFIVLETLNIVKEENKEV